jgi:lipopolysaccharide/colanic/teichoic acid biosynthesis glycosyltransferase
MIFKKEVRKSSWLGRIRSFLGSPNVRTVRTGVLDPVSFETALRKEISRCDRRTIRREFALLLLKTEGMTESTVERLLGLVQARVRFTDELGIWKGDYCLLLPETDAPGADTLACDLREIAAKGSIDLQTETQVYPWDDRIASRSNELIDGVSSSIGDQELKSDRIAAGDISVEDPDLARRAFFSGEHEIIASAPTPLWKRSFDIASSAAGLLILSPLLVGAALAVRFDSKGPIFFAQVREGKDGRLFRIYKFRTMLPDAEKLQRDLLEINEQDGPAFKIERDPRVTRVGRFLRKTCIDELPQLINVLRGEMSMVGPRPLPVSESYSSRPWHRHRLATLPGLTCIWQVSGARKVKFDQWMRMDLEYIQRRSPWFDLQLLFRTLLVVLAQRGSV